MKKAEAKLLAPILALILSILFLFSACSDSLKNKIPLKESGKKHQTLGDILVYSDSIGTYPEANLRLEQKIDSLYNEIFSYIKIHRESKLSYYRRTDEELDYFEKIVEDSKFKYKELFDLNASLYRVVVDRGTNGGSSADIYYYYYLTKYYEEIRNLQLELKDHYDEISN